ncbi:MAG: hypothetical protein WEC59_09855 [Salibacteraceae bacterium]
MKTSIFKLLVLSVIVVLNSCGNGSENNGSSENSSDSTAQSDLSGVLAKGTTLLDLSDYFMPFSLYIPDSNRGYPEIIETGYGETIITVGSTFNMIVAEGGDLSLKKQEVADDLMYENTIIEEGKDFILYKSVIKESFLDPEYHFYAVKPVNGITFEFKDNKDEGPFAESIVRFMLESVNHIVPNKPAS